MSNLPEELSILVETEMKSMKRFLRTVSCVNDSSVSCQDHLKSDSVIICIIPRCVTRAFDRHTLYVFKSLLKTDKARPGLKEEGASWHFLYPPNTGLLSFREHSLLSRCELTTQ